MIPKPGECWITDSEITDNAFPIITRVVVIIDCDDIFVHFKWFDGRHYNSRIIKREISWFLKVLKFRYLTVNELKLLDEEIIRDIIE